MDFMSLILIVVAVYVAKPAFTGKGKLMTIEHVKKDKEKTAKKGLRVAYLVMFFCSLCMIGVNYLQNTAFPIESYKVTFNEAYTAADGTTYEAGQVENMTAEQMNALYTVPESETESTSSSGTGSCMSAANVASVPCTYESVYGSTNITEKIPGADINAKYKLVRIMSTVLFCISLSDIVFLMIFINKMTDKKEKAKAQTASTGRRVSMPSNAFRFDENEPTAPDDPKVSDPEE